MRLKSPYYYWRTELLFVSLIFGLAAADVVSDVIGKCKGDCEKSLIAFPLPNAAVTSWGDRYFVGCDSQCLVRRCRDGCAQFDPKRTEKQCLAHCSNGNIATVSSGDPPSKLACDQGCANVGALFSKMAADDLDTVLRISPNARTSIQLSLPPTLRALQSETSRLYAELRETAVVGKEQQEWLAQKLQPTATGVIEITTVDGHGKQLLFGATNYQLRLTLYPLWNSRQPITSQVRRFTTESSPSLRPNLSPPRITAVSRPSDHQCLVCWQGGIAARLMPIYKVSLELDNGTILQQLEGGAKCAMFGELDTKLDYTVTIRTVVASAPNYQSEAVHVSFNFKNLRLSEKRSEAVLFSNATGVFFPGKNFDYTVSNSVSSVFALQSPQDSITAVEALTITQFLVGTKSGHVYLKNLQRTSNDVFYRSASGGGPPVNAVAFDSVTGRVYIVSGATLIVCPLDGCSPRPLQTLTLPGVQQTDVHNIAVDSWNGWLYWVNAARASVFRMALSSSQLNPQGAEQVNMGNVGRQHTPTTITIDHRAGCLLTATLTGHILATNLYNDTSYDYRDNVFNNKKHTGAKKLIGEQNRLFWVSSGKLYVEEKQSNQLIHLREFLLHEFGSITSVGWLGNPRLPAEIPPPTDIYLLADDKNGVIVWKAPKLLPHQPSTEWRAFFYDVSLTRVTGQQTILQNRTRELSYTVGSLLPDTVFVVRVRACVAANCCSEQVAVEVRTMQRPANAIKDLGDQVEFFAGSDSTKTEWVMLTGTRSPVASGKIMHDFPHGFNCHAIAYHDKIGYHRYFCVNDSVVRLERQQSYPLATIAGLRSIAMLSHRAIFVVATTHSISAYRLTGTFVRQFDVCDEEPFCASEVLGVAPDGENADTFLYLLRNKQIVTAFRQSIDGEKRAIVGSEKEFPRLRDALVFSGKLLFITADGRAGSCDSDLKHMTYYTQFATAQFIQRRLNWPMNNEAGPIRSISLVSREGQRFFKLNASAAVSGSVLHNVSVISAASVGRLVGDGSLGELAVPADVADRWRAGERLTVLAQAITAWDYGPVLTTSVSAPSRPPSPPATLQLRAVLVRSHLGVQAHVDISWTPPHRWHGAPKDYLLTCWDVNAVSNKRDFYETMLPVLYPASGYALTLSKLSSSIHCEVRSRNDADLISKNATVAYLTDLRNLDEKNAPIYTYAIDARNGELWQINRNGSRQRIAANHTFQSLTAIGNQLYGVIGQQAIFTTDVHNPNGWRQMKMHLVDTTAAAAEFSQRRKRQLPAVISIKAIAGDWVGKRLLMVGRRYPLLILYQAVLPSTFEPPHNDELVVSKLATLFSESSGKSDVGGIVVDPFSSVVYISTIEPLARTTRIIEINLITRVVTSAKLCESGFSGKPLTGALAAKFGSDGDRPTIYIGHSDGVVSWKPPSKVCTPVARNALSSAGAHGLHSVKQIAVGVGDQLYLSGNGAQDHLLLLDGDRVTPLEPQMAVAGLLAANIANQPYPVSLCLMLPRLESEQFDVEPRGLTSVLVNVHPANRQTGVCATVVTPPTHYDVVVMPGDRPCTSDNRCLRRAGYNGTMLLHGLQPRTNYSVRVSWSNAYTLDPTKKVLSAPKHFTSGDKQPSAPQNLTGFALTPTSVLLLWQPPKEPGGPLKDLCYKVILTTDAVLFGDPVCESCAEPSCSAIVHGLNNGTSYTFHVVARHKDRLLTSVDEATNAESRSAPLKMTTLPKFGRVGVTSRDATAFTITWTPMNAPMNSRLTLQYTETGISNGKIDVVTDVDATKGHTATASDLRPATSYSVTFTVEYPMAHINYVGYKSDKKVVVYTPPTAEAIVFKTSATVPSPPRRVRLEERVHGVTLVWDAPFTDGGSKITSYVVQFRKKKSAGSDSVDAWEARTVLNDTTEWRLDGEQVYHNPNDFEYRVAAFNEEGASQYSGDEILASSGFSWWYVVLAIILLLILLTCCIFGICLLRGMQQTKQEKLERMELGPMPGGSADNRAASFDALRQIPKEEIRSLPHVPRSCMTIARKLGGGAFGEVYEGLACNLPRIGPKSVRVAIKTLRQNARADERVKFLKEATTMNNFNHENIVKLLGVCLDDEPHWIILELMEGGDLLSYLRSVRPTEVMPSQVSLRDLLSILIDICRGCTYLQHQHHVHRDLAARNCLISTRNSQLRVVKIADFGLTRDVYEEDYYRVDGQGMLPVRWMAPESMIDGVFTTKTDIWSFGVVVWEVISLGHQPYPGRTNWDVLNYVRIGGLPQMPTACPQSIYDLMLECWTFRVEDRPLFDDIQSKVETLWNNSELSAILDDPFPLDAMPSSPGPNVGGPTTNHGFVNDSSGTAEPRATSADVDAGGKVRVFSAASSAKFQRNSGGSHSMRVDGRTSVNSGSVRGAVGQILRSFRRQKRKPKPTAPPSKEALDGRNRTESSSTTVTYYTPSSIDGRPLPSRQSRPDSAFSSGAESYTTQRTDYEVPLFKGLTNTQRNQRYYGDSGRSTDQSGRDNRAYSPTKSDYYLTPSSGRTTPDAAGFVTVPLNEPRYVSPPYEGRNNQQNRASQPYVTLGDIREATGSAAKRRAPAPPAGGTNYAAITPSSPVGGGAVSWRGADVMFVDGRGASQAPLVGSPSAEDEAKRRQSSKPSMV